ncbi:hypothetical protein [Bacillus sp. 445_BSPC]|uniref:hypothetical protein n=1 Tax=Bacillus sp. 445_BSPC TaxID=1581712 RepID=UPI000662AC0D|nr:hypothetical protein [Bacillus sp. 445_BSPC]
MVKKLFEVHDRLKQKESEFSQIHDSIVNEMEKNILKQYESQRFSIEGETGVFDIKGLQNEKVVFMNDEKSVHVPLDKLDSIVKPIDQDKLISEDLKVSGEIDNNRKENVNKYIEEFKGKSNDEINEKIQDFGEECSQFHQNISYSDDPKMRAKEYKEHDNMLDELEDMKEAQKILGNSRNIDLKNDIELDKSDSLVTSEEGNDKAKRIWNIDGQGIGQEVKIEAKKENEINDNAKRVWNINGEGIGEKVKIETAAGDLSQKGNEFNKANEINNEASKKLEKNIDSSIPDLKSPFLLPSQIRGQMEVLNHLKSLSDKEILNNFKVAQKEARSLDKPVAEVYKENLQQKVNERIQFSKEKILNTAINTFEKNQESRRDLREIEKEINKNMGTLYQAKLEQKISPQEYNQFKENLDQQKSKIDEKLSKLDTIDHKINEQLKVDLKQQFPEMKTDKLTLNESIGVAQAAYAMTNENTIENLKNFSLANELNGVINSIEKTTKEVEIEIEETIELSFSR